MTALCFAVVFHCRVSLVKPNDAYASQDCHSTHFCIRYEYGDLMLSIRQSKVILTNKYIKEK